MKISEAKFQDILNILGEKHFSMHVDSSDALRYICTEIAFEDARKVLIGNFGDVEISFHPEAPWFGKVRIEDEKFRNDHERYIAGKAAWCKENGCD